LSKILILLYGFIAYAIGMGGLTFFILFVGGWSFMPIHINSGTASVIGPALTINFGLILLWGLQHSIMARPGFKKTWTTIVPKAMERSTYVSISGILMIIISLNWQSIEGVLWDVENTAARTVLNVLHVSGWAIAVFSTFLINHFDLFGLQQVWFNFKDKPEPAPNYTERLFYKIVRHPLQMGFLMGFWIIPTMSWTLFSLSTFMTIYIFIGLHYEEKDLVVSLGDSYTDYQKRVRKLVPIPK